MNNNKMEIDVYKKNKSLDPDGDSEYARFYKCSFFLFPTYLESVNNPRGPQGSHLSAPGPVDPR